MYIACLGELHINYGIWVEKQLLRLKILFKLWDGKWVLPDVCRTSLELTEGVDVCLMCIINSTSFDMAKNVPHLLCPSIKLLRQHNHRFRRSVSCCPYYLPPLSKICKLAKSSSMEPFCEYLAQIPQHCWNNWRNHSPDPKTHRSFAKGLLQRRQKASLHVITNCYRS